MTEQKLDTVLGIPCIVIPLHSHQELHVITVSNWKMVFALNLRNAKLCRENKCYISFNVLLPNQYLIIWICFLLNYKRYVDFCLLILTKLLGYSDVLKSVFAPLPCLGLAMLGNLLCFLEIKLFGGHGLTQSLKNMLKVFVTQSFVHL